MSKFVLWSVSSFQNGRQMKSTTRDASN